MRPKTISTISRRRRNAQRRRALALALGICALAIPASASAYSITGDPSSGNSSESSQPPGGSDPSSVNSIAPPASEPSGSAGSLAVDPGYSSVNAIGGAPASVPTLVAGSPSSADDGFEWGSALVGAGAAMALAALGAAALLAVRRRAPVPPPAPTG
jgi:hypothetical protein